MPVWVTPHGRATSRRVKRRAASIAALLAVLPGLAGLPGTAAAAESRTSSLSWLRMPGADACIATQPLARAVEERLGREVFVSAAQADLSVEGRIEKGRTGGWHAVITMRDPNGTLLGTRELDRPDASCAAMSEPLALVIAVMIDPDAAMRPKPAPPTAEAPPPALPAPAPPPVAPIAKDEPPMRDAPAPPPPRKREPWRFEGGGDAQMIAGLAPETAWGAGVNGILYPPGVPLGFRGFASLFLPTRTDVNGTRVDFDMLLFGGSLCPTLRRRVNLMGCLGGHLGLLRPRPQGSAGAALPDDLVPIWNASAEVRVSIPITAPIAMGAGVGGALPILRPKYAGTWESSVVALTADVALGFFFP